MARKVKEPHLKRTPIFGRILPATKAYLESLGENNLGRAVDKLAAISIRSQEKAARIKAEILK